MRQAASGLPRPFWWLWASILIGRLGSFVAPFLILYLTAKRGYSASFAGLVAALFGAGGAAASVVGGILADRVGRRTTLLVAQVTAAGLTAALGFADQPLLIAVLACAAAAASGASRPVVQTVMADLVPPADRMRAFSLYYWAVNIGFGVAAASAGFISSHGYRWLFLIEAAATLLSALVIAVRLPETMTDQADTEGEGVDEKSAGLVHRRLPRLQAYWRTPTANRWVKAPALAAAPADPVPSRDIPTPAAPAALRVSKLRRRMVTRTPGVGGVRSAARSGVAQRHW